MKELFTEERLENLYKALETSGLPLDRYSWPFIPHVGRKYYQSRKRILFVGKSAAPWDDPSHSTLQYVTRERLAYSKLSQITTDFVEDQITLYGGGNGYHSPFFRRIYNLVTALLIGNDNLYPEREENASKKCFSSIAWTNVFKIGVTRGNPDRQMAEFLLTQFNTLPAEISMLKPDIVVFATGLPYDEYLKRIFPRLRIVPIESGIAKLEGVDDKALTLRTKHFQALSNEQFEHLFHLLRAAEKTP